MPKYNKHTPEGSQDYLFEECFIKKTIENELMKVFKSNGFFEIETPTLEYYDVFIADTDIISTETMFKFYDQQGRILVLRPDLTVPIARVAATKLKEESYPLRISYTGKVYRFRDLKGEGQKESTQAGIELLGSSTPEADAEVISIAINSLRSSGLENFQIDIGQVEFFKGLMEEGNFSDNEIETLRVFIDKKDMLGVEQIIKDHEINSDLKEIIMNLPAFFGSVDVIEKVKKMKLNDHSKNALRYLEKVLEIVSDYGLGRFISVDLGMVQRLNYYTGVIFRGFTYGVGFPILSGGRYDGLVEKYGRACPSVGFSINLNMVMTALERQVNQGLKPLVDIIIGYCGKIRKYAFDIAKELRSLGRVVEIDTAGLDLSGLKTLASCKEIKKIIYVTSDNLIQYINIDKEQEKKLSFQELLNEERI